MSPLVPNEQDRIVFDHVVLTPLRRSGFTLWQSPLSAKVNEGSYWPIAMWFCIFKLDFLKNLLRWALATDVKHLGHVEAFYKEKGGFRRVVDEYPQGLFGYINMQFGGFEMHRNSNWRELISGCNRAIR